MSARLAMMRHGVTSWNREHRIQGRSDIPLDEQARADLAALALPPPWDGARLWSSPLVRARDTAELVSGHPPQVDAALMEMNWGDWEGQHGATLRADPQSGFRDIEDWGWSYAPPNGESVAAIRDRVLPWMEHLRGDNVAVCHIGTMRVALALAWGWAFEGPCPFSIKRNRLYVLERDGDGWRAEPEPVRLIARSA